MSTTEWIAVVGLAVGIVGGLLTVYFAIWSKYGVNKTVERGFNSVKRASEKGFGELKTSGATLATNIDGRMGDLVEIIKALAMKGAGSITRTLKNLGETKISATDAADDSISYRVSTRHSVFRPELLAKCIHESAELAHAEREMFGEKRVEIRSLLPDAIALRLPCPDAETCGRFMALFVNWLDTEYYRALQQLEQAETYIQSHLDAPTPQAPNT